MFSFLRQLTTWHCPHLLLCAVLRRGCCWPPAVQQSIDISWPQQTRNSGVRRPDGTDRRTDARQLHRPCSTFYAGISITTYLWCAGCNFPVEFCRTRTHTFTHHGSIQGGPKKWGHKLMAIILSNINRVNLNLSLIACFLALMFHKVVWQHRQSVMGPIITTILQIYWRIFEWEDFEDRLRLDRIMAMSLVCRFLARPVYQRSAYQVCVIWNGTVMRLNRPCTPVRMLTRRLHWIRSHHKQDNTLDNNENYALQASIDIDETRGLLLLLLLFPHE